jgi:radical SAM protein with 4Fe4S-binding SPASM domain
MYNVARLRDEAEAFGVAVQHAGPFRPLMVKIKLTWRCNLACAMCDWKQNRPTPLTTELVTRTLDELAALGCRKIHFSGGEPTLRPDLPDLVAHARRLKLRVTLTTNGTLVTRELAERLVKARLNSVCVSIDSPVRSVHDAIRGQAGAFKQTLAGVRELRRASERRGVHLPVQINTVVRRDNYDTLDKLPALVHQLGAQSLLLMPVDDATDTLRLNKRRLDDYNRRIAPTLAAQALELGLIRHERDAYPFGRTRAELAASRDGHYARGLYIHQPCYAPWTHSFINADARVGPCCTAPRYLVGDVQTHSMTDIWQSDAYRRLRESMRAGSPLPKCSTCDTFLVENRILHHIYLNCKETQAL